MRRVKGECTAHLQFNPFAHDGFVAMVGFFGFIVHLPPLRRRRQKLAAARSIVVVVVDDATAADRCPRAVPSVLRISPVTFLKQQKAQCTCPGVRSFVFPVASAFCHFVTSAIGASSAAQTSTDNWMVDE